MKQNIYFHIGLHKTGTSYLQKEIFPYLFEDCNLVLGKKALKLLDGDFTVLNKGMINFISTEAASGSMRPEEMISSFNNTVQVLNRLREQGYNVKIIFAAREYSGWIKSAYTQNLKTFKKYWNESFNQFCNLFINESFFWKERLVKLSDYEVLLIDYKIIKNDFDKLVLTLNDFFNESDIILRYKKLKAEVANKQVNISPKTMSGIKLSYYFHIMPSKIKWLLKHIGIDRDIMIRIGDKLGSNNRLDLSYTSDQEQFFTEKWNELWIEAKNSKNVILCK